MSLVNHYIVSDKNIKLPRIFRNSIDNSYNPFVPKITHKYYTTYPIPEQILKIQQEYLFNPEKYHEVMIEDGKKMSIHYPHPYMQEIKELQVIPNTTIKPYNTNIDISKFIKDKKQLRKLSAKLEKVTEFGVDLQYDTIHSYLGLTCLMTIVTRTDIYFIDTLELRKDMYILQSPFANPNVLKIFLDSDLDIKSLQRDFGIYVVNMFDIVKAGIILGYLFSGKALPYFLNVLCEVKFTQMNQYVNWRVRPLRDDMIESAKKAVQYLLFMYDVLRDQLIEKSSTKDPLMYLNLALKRSKEISIIAYRKPDLKDVNYYKLSSNNLFKRINKSIFKSLYKYRDYIARIEDQGTEYICSSKLLTKIAEITPVSTLITT